MRIKLTAALVRRLTEIEPPIRDTSYFDTDFQRFALRVLPPKRAGQQWPAWYFIRYTPRGGGPERRMKSGDPRTMPLDKARAEARLLLGKVDHGGDPAADNDTRRAAWTTTEAWERYTQSPEYAKRTPRSQTEAAATTRLHVLHHLGNVKVADIDVPAARRLYRAVAADTRTNARKVHLGGPGAARGAVRRLSSLLTWCVNEGQIDRNPLIGVLRLDGGGMRTAILDQPEQYARLLATMDAMVADGNLRPMVRAFVMLLAATGLRRNEARLLQWGDIDLGARRIVLRDPKGAKLARGRPATETVSLPPLAAAALSAIRPDDAEDGDQVFVPYRGKLLSVNHDWRRICTEAELPADLVLHSLRHSIGTAGIVAGLSTAEVKTMLRHRNISTTQRYVHLAEASTSRLQDRAMDHLFQGARTDTRRA